MAKSLKSIKNNLSSNRAILKNIFSVFWITFIAAVVVFICICADVELTTDSIKNEYDKAVLGKFDGISSAIFLIGFPFLLIIAHYSYQMQIKNTLI